MKLITASAFVALALSVSSLAGPPAVTLGKETKQEVFTETPCFSEGEFQLDIFGQYSDGNGPYHAGLFREHGWGGGVGLNYFFHRNIGIGVDAAWLNAEENAKVADADNDDDDSTVFHNFSGSLIFRAPIDDLCLAPYVYVGGGFHVDGHQWASAHAGVGLEYRIVPQKVGIFVDGRWTYLGDRFGRGDLNYTSARLGMRFVF
jgi:opacity protein-like surface antigen